MQPLEGWLDHVLLWNQFMQRPAAPSSKELWTNARIKETYSDSTDAVQTCGIWQEKNPRVLVLAGKDL
jgi:hypothetical protein